MAKRASRQIVKIDDCQRTIELRTQTTSNPAVVCNTSDMLTRANRRLYEQARAYDLQVKIGTTQSNVEERYEIYTLSNAWWVKKSIEYAKAVWLHTSKEERALLGDRKGKWNQFVISCDVGNTALYSDAYQYALAANGSDMTAAQVTADEVLLEDGPSGSAVEADQDIGAEQSIGFSVMPTDTSGSERSYNIFDQYLLTRQHVTPADTRDAPYKDLLDIDSVAMDSLKKDGDNAPFNLDAFPSPWVLADTLGHDQGIPQGVVTSRMITAPLGIVVIKKLSNAGANVNYTGNEKILLMCKKGRYKGVHAPSYKATKLMFESSGVSKFKQ